MRIQWHLGICTILLAAAGWVAASELAVLAPVADGKSTLMRQSPAGSPAPVVTRVRGGKLYQAVQREADSGFTGDMLALDQLAMRVAGAGSTTWLLFSQEDGGFARPGFWLREDGRERWVDEPVVDLVVTEDSIADGSFEEIFAHELGHVMLRRVFPSLPDGYSRTAHHSFSITDQPTAFDEGFAIHFQGMARSLTRNERLHAHDLGLAHKPYLPLWLSNLDREYRVEGMRQNWFVHAQLPLPGNGDAIERRELSTLFDRARLKNVPQMLASEGAVATFFYRHLAPGAAGKQALQQRYEPMLRAMRELDRSKPGAGANLVPALAEALVRTHTSEGNRFITNLVETSYGALASPKLAAAAEALAIPGRSGDADAFVPALQAARKEMAAAVAAVQADPARLHAAAGPALWLLHPSLKAGAGGAPLAIDLNTASREHLLALPGVDEQAVQRALDSRASKGNFQSLADFAKRSGIDGGVLAALESLARALLEAGTYPRR
ncbi:MAG: ComEA family DNA-binding protein [Telluria sp.]